VFPCLPPLPLLAVVLDFLAAIYSVDYGVLLCEAGEAFASTRCQRKAELEGRGHGGVNGEPRNIGRGEESEPGIGGV
jgi:hypothetical protein